MKFKINDRVKIKGKTNRVGTIVGQLESPIIINYQNKPSVEQAAKGEWVVKFENDIDSAINHFRSEHLEIVEE